MKAFKSAVLTELIAHFEKELKALIESAQSAHQAATHEESRAEDRHDTFAIEASYLAAGQAARVMDLEKSLQELRSYFESQRSMSTADAGALIAIECDGKQTLSFVAHSGGGTQIKVDSRFVSIVSPTSPLGEQLAGLGVGDELSIETKSGMRDYKIISIE